VTTRTCRRCGASGIRRLYCSDDCMIRWHQEAAKEARAKAQSPDTQTAICLFCDTAFTYERIRNRTRSYCTEECRTWYGTVRRGTYTLEQAKQQRAAAGTQRPCGICGNLFTRHSTAMTKTYCSRVCLGTATKLKRYGITIEQYNEMVANQNGLCKMCGTKPTQLHVDHDHNTGEVRGLLCVSCNVHLGWFELNEDRVHNYRHGGKTA